VAPIIGLASDSPRPAANGARRRCLLCYEPPDGGVPAHVAELALGLRDHGWEPVVAAPAGGSTIDGLLRSAGIPLVRVALTRSYARPQRDARALFQLTRLVRSGRFALVHGHAAKAGVLVRLAAAANGVPSIYTPHCFPFVGSVRRERRVFALAAERRLAPLTAAVICVASAELRVARSAKVAPPDRLHVIHNGTRPCTEVAPDERLIEFAAGGPLVGSLTVLRPQKSIETLIAAAPHILRELPAVRLAVIGEGPLRSRLEALAAQRGLEGRLRFFDFSPPAARALAALDLFVHPSAWEAFPIAVLEALACGVPQVATDVGGTAEAVVHEETGLLCRPGDPAALAAAVVRLVADPGLRARMGANARRRHAERFDVKDMVARTAQLYTRAASG
jgi:glycosyltransferase involved in cell wall biosynthesis